MGANSLRLRHALSVETSKLSLASEHARQPERGPHLLVRFTCDIAIVPPASASQARRLVHGAQSPCKQPRSTLIAAVRERWPAATAVGLDLSSPLLDRARARFAGSPEVTLLNHDLMEPLPTALGAFDVVVSGLAVHHLPDRRKHELFEEVFSILEPGGVFCLLDVVASPTPELHERAQVGLGFGPQDQHPSDQPARLEDQLAWLREVGFDHVDCFWKWLELAVLAGTKSP